MRLAVVCAVFAALTGCDVFYPLDGFEARERVQLMQRADAQASNTREMTVALPSPPASGNTLILVAASTDSVPQSVTGSSTWTRVTSSQMHIALAIWTTVVPAGAAGSVKVTWPTDTATHDQTTALVHLSEWSGLAAAGPKAENNGIPGGPVVTRTLSVGDGVGLVLAAGAAHAKPTLDAPPAGFTSLPTLARTDTQLAVAYTLSPPAGMYGVSWPPGATDGWEAHIASFTRTE